MKPAALLCLAAMVALSPAAAWCADAPVADKSGRVVIAERKFGDVRFVIGGGTAMKWLEMYANGILIAAFRDFAADDVIAAPDRKHFLAISNTSKSSYAFAVLDRTGHVLASSPHGGDLHYCNRTAWGVGEWADIRKPEATFIVKQNQMTSPATDYVQVTVRGCDGKTVLLARAPAPEPKAAGGTVGTRVPANTNTVDRSSFFIGNTIANLRGMDPSFGSRTLTLVDGRRSIPGSTEALAMPITWTEAPVSKRRSCSTSVACDSGTELLISRADGSTQVFATGLVGDFIVLPRSQRIFDCSNNTSSGQQQNPVVVSLNGDKTSLPAHPGPLRICARTGTGDEVLMAYTVVQAGTTYMLARVFGASGALLAEGSYATAGVLEFIVAGEVYSATVPAP